MELTRQLGVTQNAAWKLQQKDLQAIYTGLGAGPAGLGADGRSAVSRRTEQGQTRTGSGGQNTLRSGIGNSPGQARGPSTTELRTRLPSDRTAAVGS